MVFAKPPEPFTILAEASWPDSEDQVNRIPPPSLGGALTPAMGGVANRAGSPEYPLAVLYGAAPLSGSSPPSQARLCASLLLELGAPAPSLLRPSRTKIARRWQS